MIYGYFLTKPRDCLLKNHIHVIGKSLIRFHTPDQLSNKKASYRVKLLRPSSRGLTRCVGPARSRNDLNQREDFTPAIHGRRPAGSADALCKIASCDFVNL